jgi:formiminoglutamase
MENELNAPLMANDPSWPRASEWLAGRRAPYSQRKLAVLGVPSAMGSITPGRCDLAPAAVREALYRFSTYDVDTGDDLESVAAIDRGDLAVEKMGVAEAFEPITDGVRSALKGVDALILLGGDNSITRAGVHGLGVALERCGLLTFDAHLDLRDLGGGLTNGNPVRALLRDGLPGRNIVQMGLQPFANSRQYHEVALDAGITVISSGECRRRGVETVVDRALAQLAQHCDAIYVDFDIDVLDRAYAPACPGARPGGITPAELRSAARICGENAKVRIADLVEVDPECDVARVTIYAMCMCLLGFASGVACRKHL